MPMTAFHWDDRARPVLMLTLTLKPLRKPASRVSSSARPPASLAKQWPKCGPASANASCAPRCRLLTDLQADHEFKNRPRLKWSRPCTSPARRPGVARIETCPA